MGNAICSIEGCERRHKAHGWCGAHYSRWLRHGDPLAGYRPRIPNGLSVVEAFRVRMPGDPPAPGVVWSWTGPRQPDGYGYYRAEGHHHLAHRVSYELFIAPIPEGLFIRHKNDTPWDVNPWNLELGTHLDNMKDKFDRQRQARGMNHGRRKLTADQVRDIRYRRDALGETLSSLAARFGVSVMTIQRAASRESWRHLH